MATNRRDTDIEKWSDHWFQALDPNYKLFWMYLCDRVDWSGYWKVNMREAVFHTGASLPGNAKEAMDVLNRNELGFEDPLPRIIAVGGDVRKWWIRGFMYFHYANRKTGKFALGLSWFHQRILQDVRANGLEDLVNQYYPNCITNDPLQSHRPIPVPTLEEVMQLSAAQGMNEAGVTTFWKYWNQRGWRMNGQPRCDYEEMLTEWKRRGEVMSNERLANIVSVGEIDAEIQRLNAQIFELRKDTEWKEGAQKPNVKQAAREKIMVLKVNVGQLETKRKAMGGT